MAGGAEPPSLTTQDGGHHCQQLLLPYFSICIFTLSSSFLGNTRHPAPAARHQAPGNCTPRDALITNTNSHALPLSLQAGEQTPSLLSRSPLEQKGRSGTLWQRNASVGYQENFFPYQTFRRQLWCSPRGRESSSEQLLRHGKSVSVRRGEG